MKYWFIVILTLTFAACQDVKHPQKPKNLIAKDKMAEVLTEAYLANAGRSVDNKTLLVKGVKLDSLIYVKFGIDSLQFVRSNDYYAANINSYVEIFQKVEDNLKLLEAELDSIRVLERGKDTLTKNPVERERNIRMGDSLR